MLSKLAIAAAVAAIPAAYAFAQSDSGAMHGGMMMKPGTQMSEADKGYIAAMQVMNHRMMEMEMTGDPSGDFARMMIPHHQSAIDMAEVLLGQKDIDPEMKALAEKIIQDQTREIQHLQAWLEAHGQ